MTFANSLFERAFQAQQAKKLELMDSQIAGNLAEAGYRDEQAEFHGMGAMSDSSLDMANAGAIGAEANFAYSDPNRGTTAMGQPTPMFGAAGFQQGQSQAPSGAMYNRGFSPGMVNKVNQGEFNIVDGKKTPIKPKAYGDTFAEGGEVPGYSLYRKAAEGAAIPELDMQQVGKIVSAIRAAESEKMAQALMSGATMPMYAQGGEVDVGGAMVQGPGTGTSDSIPAMIDGVQPAAISNGEFVIPKNIVEYYGTKFFDTLLEKAKMAERKTAKNSAMGTQ